MDPTIQVAQARGKAPGLTFHPELGSPKTCFRVPHSAVPHLVHSRQGNQTEHKPACFASAEAHLSGFVHPRPVPHDAAPGALTLKCTMSRISRSQPHLRQPDPAPFTVLIMCLSGWVRYEPGVGQNRRISKALLPSTIPRPSHMICSLDLPVGAGQLAFNACSRSDRRGIDTK